MLTFLTDLSPVNVCQGSTDPRALESLSATGPTVRIRHLPRLHAKVYLGDTDRAIIGSGNLTSGGLALNYEYAVEILARSTVQAVRRDILAYSKLGVDIPMPRLCQYCEIANQAREAFRRKQAATRKSVERYFHSALREAEDELVRLRLAGGAMHTVFAGTILYLLRAHGPLSTRELHPLIERIHPELCDNTVDRVIDGKRFGKKWKHAARTAQQQLKKKILVRLVRGRWRLVNAENNHEVVA